MMLCSILVILCVISKEFINLFFLKMKTIKVFIGVLKKSELWNFVIYSLYLEHNSI
jgi:hypothetical protein